MNAGNLNLSGGDSQIYGTVQMQAPATGGADKTVIMNSPGTMNPDATQPLQPSGNKPAPDVDISL